MMNPKKGGGMGLMGWAACARIAALEPPQRPAESVGRSLSTGQAPAAETASARETPDIFMAFRSSYLQREMPSAFAQQARATQMLAAPMIRLRVVDAAPAPTNALPPPPVAQGVVSDRVIEPPLPRQKPRKRKPEAPKEASPSEAPAPKKSRTASGPRAKTDLAPRAPRATTTADAIEPAAPLSTIRWRATANRNRGARPPVAPPDVLRHARQTADAADHMLETIEHLWAGYQHLEGRAIAAEAEAAKLREENAALKTTRTSLTQALRYKRAMSGPVLFSPLTRPARAPGMDQ